MKKTTKKSPKKASKKIKVDLLTEIIGISMIGLSLLVLASLFTNQVGIVGVVIKSLFTGLLGIGGYILPLCAILLGYYYIKGDFNKLFDYLKYIIPFLIIMITLFHLISYGQSSGYDLWGLDYFKYGTYLNGGFIGALLGEGILKLLGLYGSYIVLIVLLGIWLLMATQFPLMSWLSGLCKESFLRLKEVIHRIQEENKVKKAQKSAERKLRENEKKVEAAKNAQKLQTQVHQEPLPEEDESPISTVISEDVPSLVRAEMIEQTDKATHIVKPIETDEEDESISTSFIDHTYHYPSIELLKKADVAAKKAQGKATLNHAKKLEDTLLSFGVEARVTQINKGPTVTRYELQPKQGVKVSKIVNLADDIALNLAASGIRIEAPIPGKAAVGIEVPNESSEMVYLREVIESDQFVAFPSKLAFALGKDIAGKPIVTDISKMPHMLIAGATGSGKSVCINTLITSILYKASPKEVKLIMIDPKVVELNVYNGIPHLLIPVVTDPKKAAGALCWAVNEMTKRYQQFADNNVRDMKGFNAKVAGENLKMPSIIIIIDELADLMMTAAKEVEDAICRLAQMARAAGIHLVIATQRPSVDVITGVIKANIPSRLAFAVSSGIDSRTILDSNGAEKLLGKGDMLFCPIGESKPIRIQGAFISDHEVETIVEAVKSTGEVQYEEAVMESIAAPSIMPSEGNDEEDELVLQAIELAQDKEKLSISMLQRYFRIGFNRASRLMEALEAKGVVGPDEGSKPRKVIQNHLNKGDEL